MFAVFDYQLLFNFYKLTMLLKRLVYKQCNLNFTTTLRYYGTEYYYTLYKHCSFESSAQQTRKADTLTGFLRGRSLHGIKMVTCNLQVINFVFVLRAPNNLNRPSSPA